MKFISVVFLASKQKSRILNHQDPNQIPTKSNWCARSNPKQETPSRHINLKLVPYRSIPQCWWSCPLFAKGRNDVNLKVEDEKSSLHGERKYIVGAKAQICTLGLKPYLLMGIRLRRSRWLGRPQNR